MSNALVRYSEYTGKTTSGGQNEMLPLRQRYNRRDVCLFRERAGWLLLPGMCQEDERNRRLGICKNIQYLLLHRLGRHYAMLQRRCLHLGVSAKRIRLSVKKWILSMLYAQEEQ